MNRKLHRALERLVEGNTETAVEQLRDFVLEVEGLVEKGELSADDGEELGREARALIRRIGEKEVHR